MSYVNPSEFLRRSADVKHKTSAELEADVVISVIVVQSLFALSIRCQLINDYQFQKARFDNIKPIICLLGYENHLSIVKRRQILSIIAFVQLYCHAGI